MPTRPHPCTASPAVTCCNHKCNQGRDCRARASMQDGPATPAERRMVVLACIALCGTAWAALLLLPPWSTWWAGAVALAGDYGWAMVGGAVGLLAVGRAVYAVVTYAIDRHVPADAGDTHAAFPPPTRTADAQRIERQAAALLRRAERDARDRHRLAQQLRTRQLRASYDAARRPATTAADWNGQH